MQVIYKNEDKRVTVEKQIQWILFHVQGGISGYIEEKCTERLGRKITRI